MYVEKLSDAFRFKNLFRLITSLLIRSDLYKKWKLSGVIR